MNKALFIFNSRRRSRLFSGWTGFGYGLKDCYEGDDLEKWNEFVDKYRNLPSFGFLSYELLHNFWEFRNIKKKRVEKYAHKFPLIWWGVFRSSDLKEKNKTQNIEDIVGFEQQNYFELLGELNFNISPADYIKKVKTIKNYIRNGDVYQVNLSLRIDGQYRGSPLFLYKYLDENLSLPYSIFFSCGKYSFITLSPELFLLKDGENIYTRPIKGTLPRGGRSLHEAKEYFKKSVKEKRELDMIIDVERNDFYRICERDSVKVLGKKVEIFPNVYHNVATVGGRLRKGITLADIIKNCFPSSSVTGAPKSSAIKIINELEPHRRFIYTGGIGFHFKDTLLLVMGIRSILFKENELHIYTGSGITYLSDPKEELKECEVKINNYRILLERFKSKN